MRPRNPSERGAVLVLVAVMIVVLIAFAALVIDIGKMYKVRGELQNASDSAAHAAAISLDHTAAGIAAARDKAKEYALLHNADGTGVALDDSDIIFGHWDEATRTFTALGTDPADPAAVNAVRVIDRRQQATQNSVALNLAPLLGMPQVDVHSDAIAIAGGPRGECGFPMVVPDCTLNQALEDGTCAHCMTYQDNNTDTAGWTSFDAGSVGGPTITALIRSA
jgi:Flp pilus assembly protein TadG